MCIYAREMHDLIIDEDDFSFDLNGLNDHKTVNFECAMDMLYPTCSSDNLTLEQQWISFGVDVTYTISTFAIGYGVGSLIALIPGVGVFIAPFAAAGITLLIDLIVNEWGWVSDVKQWIYDLQN